MQAFRDDFDGDTIDTGVWLPHYLPAWSSRAESAAHYSVGGSMLSLYIPADADLWCPDTHPEPLRVSGMATGNWSGPVGSSEGQQPFAGGLVVKERQPRFTGWLPTGGRIAIRCRMELSRRSMAAMWLAGFEDVPQEAGELCVVEVFGRSVSGSSAEIGLGVKQLRDPRLVHDFHAPRLDLDVSRFHEYAVDWAIGSAAFSVDGAVVHRTATAPAYAMQVMIAVFDFPNDGTGTDDRVVPLLEIDWIEGIDAPS